MRTVLPTSPYFSLQQLAAGIYAAIIVPGMGAWGNAGIVDLGDGALVFDTFLTPQAARALRAAAEQVTGAPIRYVVNSHYHLDHVQGNQVFSDALIVATELTRDTITLRNAAVIAEAANLPQEVEELEALLRAETDERLQADRALELGEYRALSAARTELELRLPTLTFTEHIVFHGAHRRAELLSYGGGHTVSDTFLYLPGERIAFMGDLVPVQTHPSFFGDADTWLRILERIMRLDVQWLVPGHGAVGTLADCEQARQYIVDLQALAREVAARGGEDEEAAAQPIPTAYATWAAPTTFAANMRYFSRRLSQAPGWGGEYAGG
jgi:glyoxylase-like metal-dependent hydrolase (beta-lactamase superfamily II)